MRLPRNKTKRKKRNANAGRRKSVNVIAIAVIAIEMGVIAQLVVGGIANVKGTENATGPANEIVIEDAKERRRTKTIADDPERRVAGRGRHLDHRRSNRRPHAAGHVTVPSA